MRWAEVPGELSRHFRDAGLPWLFAESFLLMGGFVCVYNYIGFRLLDPPYSLSQTVIGLIFVGVCRRHGESASPANGEPLRAATRCCGSPRASASPAS